jgi:hypothetical protein
MSLFPGRRVEMPKTKPVRDQLYIRAFLVMAQKPPDQQLREVLRFLLVNLRTLGVAERTRWSSRLRALTFPPLASESGRLVLRFQGAPHRPLAASALAAVQTAIRRGLKAVLAPSSAVAWPLPDLRGGVMIRDADSGTYLWQWRPDGETWPIILGTTRLVAEYADRIRACKQCGAWFFAVKRQEYCTPAHGQQARDQKKAERKRGGSR